MLVDLNFFDNNDDIDAMVEGLKLMRKICLTPPLADIIERCEQLPNFATATDAELRDYLLRTVQSTWHYRYVCYYPLSVYVV